MQGLRLFGKEGFMEKTELVLDALANRALLYRYAWRLFSAPPDEAVLSLAASVEPGEAAAVLAGGNARLVKLQERLSEEAARAIADEAGALERLRSEYTKLFEGPGKLPAPPWESVYRTEGDLLFQECTLEVRQAYREAGFKAAAYPHEADDQVATELSFMVALIEEAVAALTAGDAVRAHAFLTAQKKFLSQHLNEWLPAFAERLNTQAPKGTSPFYPLAALFAAELCVQDAPIATELADAVA